MTVTELIAALDQASPEEATRLLEQECELCAARGYPRESCHKCEGVGYLATPLGIAVLDLMGRHFSRMLRSRLS